MFSTRINSLALAGALAVALAACGGAGGASSDRGGGPAAGYPKRDVTLIFPFAAGSPGDVNARALSKQAERFLKTGIQVVNRAGAAGTIGATEVIQAKPDGYTVGLVPIATMMVQPQRTKLPYGGPDDYRPVMGVSVIPEALTVRADSPWRTLNDFLADAKSRDQSVATTGEGTILDIDAKLLAMESGTRFKTIAFDGEQQALAATVGGTTNAAVSGVSVALPFVKSGRARVLGVFSEKRVPSLPDVPTMPELGYNVTFGVNNFIIAPKGTDDAVVKVLGDAFHQAWKTEEYQTFLDKNGFIPQYMPTSELKTFLSAQYKQYGEVLTKLGLRK